MAEGAGSWPGGGVPAHLPGYFVEPTVIADVTRDATVAQEEIFGPVLVVIPYDGEEDAVAHRQRLRSTACRARWSAARSSGPGRSRDGCGRAPSR